MASWWWLEHTLVVLLVYVVLRIWWQQHRQPAKKRKKKGKRRRWQPKSPRDCPACRERVKTVTLSGSAACDTLEPGQEPAWTEEDHPHPGLAMPAPIQAAAISGLPTLGVTL